MKFTALLLALVITLFFPACASGPDRTPEKQETRAAVAVAGKVVGTPIVFTAGVITWPVGLVGAVAAVGQGEPEYIAAGLGWPFLWTYLYWVDPFSY